MGPKGKGRFRKPGPLSANHLRQEKHVVLSTRCFAFTFVTSFRLSAHEHTTLPSAIFRHMLLQCGGPLVCVLSQHIVACSKGGLCSEHMNLRERLAYLKESLLGEEYGLLAELKSTPTS